MKAEILSVGTEILLGDILNTNAQYLSKNLAEMGIGLYHQTVVGDNETRLLESLDLAFKRCDLVITTGGLGPTSDDITKEIAAKFFNRDLYLHKESLNFIKEYYKATNREMPKNNIKQAYIIEDSTILENPNGTAPGCIVEDNGKILVILPGPPREMKPMFENLVKPYLSKYLDSTLFSKVLRTIDLGESTMASKVEDLILSSTNPTIAPYAKNGEAILRITAKGKNKDEALKLIKPVEEELIKRLYPYVYGFDDTNIQTEVCKLLIEKNLTIATAESCTGGLVASKLIEYAGISSSFIDGIVSYSNESKIKLLHVKEETLNKFGAVSSETAEEMAKGACKVSCSNVGVSTTGIAGPTGGTTDKPVGLVYVGVCINGNTNTLKLNLRGDRNQVRELAAMKALNFLRKNLLNIK